MQSFAQYNLRFIKNEFFDEITLGNIVNRTLQISTNRPFK